MNKTSQLVVIEMSMSLDGFVAGPGATKAHGLGKRGGEHVFDWYNTGNESYPPGSMFKPEGSNRRVVEQMFSRFGAYVSGRQRYDLTEGWHGRHPVNGVPVFILTHVPDPHPPKAESKITFVTTGVESAINQAKAAADGKDVSLLGASAGQQALALRMVDEIFVHVAPILIGAGVRLFENIGEHEIELDPVETFEGPKAVHLRYRVRR